MNNDLIETINFYFGATQAKDVADTIKNYEGNKLELVDVIIFAEIAHRFRELTRTHVDGLSNWKTMHPMYKPHVRRVFSTVEGKFRERHMTEAHGLYKHIQNLYASINRAYHIQEGIPLLETAAA